MKVIFVDGGKGGVGKSTIALAITDILYHDARDKIAVVDADTRNPDVARITQAVDGIDTMIASLRTQDDWAALLGEIERLAGDGVEYCVLSLAAGENSVQQKAPTAAAVFRALAIEAITVHVMNRGVDSVAIARESLESGLASISDRFVAVMNGYFGAAEAFCRWRDSQTRRRWQERGGLEVWVPELYYQCVDAVSHSQRLPSDLATDPAAINTVGRIQIIEWIDAIRSRLAAPLGLLEDQEQQEAAANG